MKILYLAKHDSGDNDDEGAITFSLRKLGHEVVRVHERADIPNEPNVELLLCHKSYNFGGIKRSLARVKAFWHFDLIESDDWDLKVRTTERLAWIQAMTDVVDIGFCTDGDWVKKDTTGKLKCLMQGADERVIGRYEAAEVRGDILFTGSLIHGGKRISHIRHLQEKWGSRFVVFGHHAKERRHGKELAQIMNSFKIVIAPDGPITHHYWSNRVYLTLGFGAFLLHPYCRELLQDYNVNELVYYHSREELDELIDYYLDHREARQQKAKRGYKRTLEANTYTHRCVELLKYVQEKLDA